MISPYHPKTRSTAKQLFVDRPFNTKSFGFKTSLYPAIVIGMQGIIFPLFSLITRYITSFTTFYAPEVRFVILFSEIGSVLVKPHFENMTAIFGPQEI